ncbi:MAG: diguanylate cyclase [Gammaproteobacteria bacterium]|nr:diguanylate cyclase [Gammaproteobacteria bacterium]
MFKIYDKLSLTRRRIIVLLVDDQAIIGESVQRMLAAEQDIDFHYCRDPVQAIKTANRISPTVILQDLVMPEVDGLTLVRYYRANPSTRNVPVIVLSTSEEPVTKAEAFALGANDYLVKLPDRLELIARIRHHSKGYINLLQKNEAYEKLYFSIEEKEEHARELALLNHMGNLLHACHTERETYHVAVDVYKDLFPADSGCLYIFNKTAGKQQPAVWWGGFANEYPEFEPKQCQALQRGEKMHIVEDPRKGTFCSHLAEGFSQHYMCVPIITQNEIIGLFHLIFEQSENGARDELFWRINEEKKMIIIRMMEHYALSLGNLRLRETLKKEAIQDPLTGLYNRRHMEKSLEREVTRARRHDTPIGIIMIDIDYFKYFNDTYGHETGDVVLRELGKYLKKSIRGEDIACRYGGEEFILIMPGASLENTGRQAEKFCSGVKEAIQVEHKGKILSISVSLGIASYPDQGSDIQDVLKAADLALYQAKAAGRDQAVISK